MRNAWTIFRRDFSAFFTSPIGYIFMIVFLLISVGLYITGFFAFPVADMRPFFGNLPLILCVFIPAVTMRVWAEERKENTWEMLLTFPMRASELVVGKFLACLVFVAITLAATCTVPVMLMALGNPDMGSIIGGYLGALLLSAFFLSMGIFFSGFCKDQIVAFVVTLLACFAVFLLGTTFIAAYLDGLMSGLGTTLNDLVGVLNHYNAFTRGVVEVGDVLFFLAWTVLFLVLNMLYIESRGRHHAPVTFYVALAICVGIGLLFNGLISGASLGRFDMTEDRIYTVSDASGRILRDLDTPVQVTLYITPRGKMPTQLNRLEQDIRDKLEELRIASGGNLRYNVIHMEVANVLALDDEDLPEDEIEALEKRMYDKGVRPFSVQAMSEDQVTSMLIYSSLGVAYRDRPEEIIPQIMPQALPELEYLVVNTVYKLTMEDMPVVALVAPKEAVTIPPEMRSLYEQMGQPIPTTEDPYVYLEEILRHEKYDVRRIELTRESPLPAEFDTLVVVNPRNLSERQRWEINRALVSGKPVVLAVQKYEWDYQAKRTGMDLTLREERPEINPLLDTYGLAVSEEVLMDTNDVALTVQSSANPLAALLGGAQTLRLPTHILVSGDNMDTETSITSRLSSIFYLWGTALDIDEDTLKQHGLEANVLMTTTSDAWTVSKHASLTEKSFEPPAAGGRQYPLMALVSGQFPDAYAGESRPAWPPERPEPGQPPRPPAPEADEPGPVTPAPSKLVLLGCSQMFRRNFLEAGNLDLFLNSVDAVTLGDDLINVRGRKPIDRRIEQPKPGTRAFWRTVNYGLAPAVIAVAGIVMAVVRIRRRNAYTVRYARGEAR